MWKHQLWRSAKFLFKSAATHHINDLPFALEICKATMYADHTNMSYSSRSIEDLTDTLNCELKGLKEWIQGNKLCLNVIKTQAMIIRS